MAGNALFTGNRKRKAAHGTAVRQVPLSIVPLGEKNDDCICRTPRRNAYPQYSIILHALWVKVNKNIQKCKKLL